ncbi:IS982 family transposase, partial [candidate division KSB1 bacterium]|nr:IS982 family transposase [candidate division KSB1 bacterium]
LATEIFVSIDDFYTHFNQQVKEFQLPSPKKRRNRSFLMSGSEVMTILVLFHLSQHRSLKHFYLYYVKKHMQAEFPQTVSYNRFVELMSSVLLPLTIYLKTCRSGKCSGISFVDSTPLKVCHNKRIGSNKVFADIAQRGKTSMGWFFGFKLHIIVNDKGEVINFAFTEANVDDRQPLISGKLLKEIWGKLFGDRGYISQTLFQTLFVDGIHLITKIRKNMKNSLMNINDKILLRKRALIETINDELKNICQIEHSRHRSVVNFVSNTIAGLIAYSFLPKKPAIKCQFQQTKQIAFC